MAKKKKPTNKAKPEFVLSDLECEYKCIWKQLLVKTNNYRKKPARCGLIICFCMYMHVFNALHQRRENIPLFLLLR